MNNIKFIVLNLFVFFASLYLLTASGPNFYETDAAQLRFEVAKSIIERNDINVSENIGIQGSDGRYYSWVGIGSAIVSIPFYLVSSILKIPPKFTIQCLNLFFGAATVVLVFLFVILLGYSKRVSLLVALSYGLGTFAWPLTKQPFDNTMETFFVLFSVYLIYLYNVNQKTPFLLFSAFSLGFAFITRLTSILVLPSLFIIVMYSFSKKSKGLKRILRNITKEILLFSLAFIPFLCLYCWYNYYRFGSIFETGYSLIASRTGLDFFSGTPLLTGLGGLLISPGKGFFYYSPIAILSLFSFRSFMKKHRSLSFSFLLIIVSYLLFLSRNIYWHGDWAWGPRYLLVLTPFFIIPLVGLIDSMVSSNKKPIKNIVYIIFSLSLIIQLAAISVDFQKYFFYLTYEDKVKFDVVHGSGVPRMKVPPPEIYFNCDYSPIIKQFNFIYQIAIGIKDYGYVEPPENATIYEKLKMVPAYNVFDFWWLYEYFILETYLGFVIAFILFFVVIYAALKLWVIVRDENRNQPHT